MRNHGQAEGSAVRRPVGARRARAALCLGALALSGCGGSEQRPAARSPCAPAIRSAVATLADAPARARLRDRSSGPVTCTYRAGAPTDAEIVRVTVDRAPQAAWRFSRAVVERSQAHLGGDPRELPVQVEGLGDGAAWAAAPRELMATARGRLVTVTVLARASGAPRDRAAAVAVARAALG